MSQIPELLGSNVEERRDRYAPPGPAALSVSDLDPSAPARRAAQAPRAAAAVRRAAAMLMLLSTRSVAMEAPKCSPGEQVELGWS